MKTSEVLRSILTSKAYQLASGEKQVRIPKFILNKSVSRRALAVAIHSVLPMLEVAEKVVRPRMGEPHGRA